MFGENFLSSKPGEIYLRVINKLLDKLQDMIQNISEYTIHRNQFFVKLFMNKLYFTKAKIIYDPTQYIIYIYI